MPLKIELRDVRPKAPLQRPTKRDQPGTERDVTSAVVSQVCPAQHIDGNIFANGASIQACAAQQCFATNELLEMILAELDMGQLLMVQKVCKPWQTMITSSKILQCKLFMSPSGPLTTYYLKPIDNDFSVQNDGRPCNFDWMSDEPARVVNPDVNPLLTSEPCRDTPDCHHIEFQRHCLGRGEPSWHRMFLTQPPAKHLSFCAPGCTAYFDFAISEERGVRMRHVEEAVVSVCKMKTSMEDHQWLNDWTTHPCVEDQLCFVDYSDELARY